jgi:hypothetical protein
MSAIAVIARHRPAAMNAHAALSLKAHVAMSARVVHRLSGPVLARTAGKIPEISLVKALTLVDGLTHSLRRKTPGTTSAKTADARKAPALHPRPPTTPPPKAASNTTAASACPSS